MLANLFQLFRQAYGGLPRQAWLLAAIMLVNRSGTMVVLFLAVYLTKVLHFSLEQAGSVLSVFGVGALIGTYLGGKLTDRFGHFWVQFGSLALGGLLFFGLIGLRTFPELVVGVFLLSVVSEAFRPANSASVAHYNPPEHLARAYSLNRLAINLGFSVGPALGGLLAVKGYFWLFLADGATCLASAGLLFWLFAPRGGPRPLAPRPSPGQPAAQPLRSPFRDRAFMAFMLLVLANAICFFQLFSTLPLYYRTVYGLSEEKIGWLMALNGLLVALLEMPVVYKIGDQPRKMRFIAVGTLLVGLGYAVLNAWAHWSVLVLGVVVLTLGEIFTMPFMNVFAVGRSQPQNRGQYLAVYSMAYSAAHTLAPLVGTLVVAQAGFATLWWLIGGVSVTCFWGFWRTREG
jgi:predicted MFS family arabinose efflux permease